MTMRWMPTESERRILPETGLRGPMPAVIAIMTFATMIIAAAGLAVSHAADMVANASQDRLVVQIPDAASGAGPRMERLLTATPGVMSAQAVPEDAMREMLERWLGPASQAASLPVPALVHVTIRPGTDRAPIAASVARAIPDARLVEERAAVGPLLGSLRAVQWLALALVVLMSVAASAAVILAARGALDTHRATVDIMHGIGATDTQIARLFQFRIAQAAAAGSLAGGLSAALLLGVLATALGRGAGDLAGRGWLGTGDIVILALVPLAATLIATGVARQATLRALRRAP